MNSKSLLIAIAAFAVTTTGAQAFSDSSFLRQSGLDEVQVEAFSEARELRLKGKNDEARDVLLKAGVNEKTMRSLRLSAKPVHKAIEQAIQARDFEAFKEAVKGTPLYDLVTTASDFLQFVEAHDLRSAGKVAESRTILHGLGIDTPSRNGQTLSRHGWRFSKNLLIDDGLSEAERDALRVARQANDTETIDRILADAGVVDRWTKAKKGKGEKFFQQR